MYFRGIKYPLTPKSHNLKACYLKSLKVTKKCSILKIDLESIMNFISSLTRKNSLTAYQSQFHIACQMRKDVHRQSTRWKRWKKKFQYFIDITSQRWKMFTVYCFQIYPWRIFVTKMDVSIGWNIICAMKNAKPHLNIYAFQSNFVRRWQAGGPRSFASD